jgi:hypothetical protein
MQKEISGDKKKVCTVVSHKGNCTQFMVIIMMILATIIKGYTVEQIKGKVKFPEYLCRCFMPQMLHAEARFP